MSASPLHSVSVAGVAFDEAGRVLVIRRRDNGQWQAPGGVLELDETFEQGVAREVLEETGVRVKVDRLTGVYKNVLKGVVALVYRCTAIGGQALPSDEADRVQWIDCAEALEMMLPAFAVRVSDACDEDEFVASRTHDGTVLLERED